MITVEFKSSANHARKLIINEKLDLDKELYFNISDQCVYLTISQVETLIGVLQKALED